MTIRVYKVADVTVGVVRYADNRKVSAIELSTLLASLPPPENPLEKLEWSADVVIGAGLAARTMRIDLQPLIPVEHRPDTPLFIKLLGRDAEYSLIYFAKRLFMPEREPETESDREEIILRIKKAAYEEDAELATLRNAVANLEAASEFQKNRPKRDQIPDDVKLVVWARDGGACVRCGSKQDLHFDHIIPVAKGGGNSEANIQILCQACNLRKSDKIGVA